MKPERTHTARAPIPESTLTLLAVLALLLVLATLAVGG